MFSFLSFLGGILAVIGVLVLKPYVNNSTKARWAIWAGIGAWYLWTLLGISFVIINAMYKHTKPAIVGAFLFFIVSIAGAIILARVLGILNTKKANSSIST